MHICPICATSAFARFQDTPYWVCPACDCWFQSPTPAKLYEAPHEKDARGGCIGHLMSDRDKAVNRSLAEHLFHQWLGGHPSRTLDIGSKYPYLAHCLSSLGCNAYGMDNIEIVPTYSRDLGVPMIVADFEQVSDTQLYAWAGNEPFKLITLVHMFEHIYHPLAALRKLRRIVADDGFLFLRLPDHSVSGFERDLTPGHFTIHPYFYAFSTLLELLVQSEDLFTVIHTAPLEGAGQRDLVLRPLTHKPIVYGGMIVKNEMRDLPRCLRSIEAIVDGVVIVDTGSTDATLAVATSTIKKPVLTQIYTDASQQDEQGDWKLWNFSQARNIYIDEIESLPVDWILWMDADDELLTPANLRRAFYWSQFDIYGVQIESDGQRWVHHRLWKTGLHIRYEGRCHEYPSFGSHPSLELSDTVIRHDATPGHGESANQRNLRILLEEFTDTPSPRTAFYIGNTHKDGCRFIEAVPWYTRRIAMGEDYRDEWLTAYLYKARCERAAGDPSTAERTLLEAVSKDRRWAEFWMELAYLSYDQHRFHHAMSYALQAVDAPIPATQLWRERNKYTDQPPRLISWCHEHLGDFAQAHAWALKARDRIGQFDADWETRIQRLGIALKTGTSLTGHRLALHRPGAIGDILMTLNLVPCLRARYPDHAIHYFCDPTLGAALAGIMQAAGVDIIEDCATFSSQQQDFTQAFNLIGYPLHEGYPERPMKRHLLQYFAEELGLDATDLPTLTLPRPARPIAVPERYATLQPKAGWSEYKNWPFRRWEEVLHACPKIPVYQIGPADAPPIAGARHDFLGATLDISIALVANSQMHLGIDSFANHLTHYRWRDEFGNAQRVPAVILWGSTQPSAAGYPHNTNLSAHLTCQPCFREDPRISQNPRGPCINPPEQTYERPEHACMSRLSIKQVAEAAIRIWHRAY